jgi:hypothetical protein
LKVLFHYEVGDALSERVAGLARQGLSVRVVSQADTAGFAAALPQTEVIWHVLAVKSREVVHPERG